MEDNRPQNRNVKTTIVNGRYVSSAEIWRHFGFWTAAYETYVWEYDEETKARGKWLYETYQHSEDEAIKVHDHFVNNFREEASE